MKHLTTTKGYRGHIGKCYEGGFHRRMNVAMHLRRYKFNKPQWDSAHLRDFVYVAVYNAWLRQLEAQRRYI